MAMKPLQDHHVVEGHAAFLLALDRAGDDGGLGGVEAGQDAAGHSHKEHGQEVTVGKIVAIAEGGSGAVSCSLEGGEGGSLPVVPQVQQGIALDEQGWPNTPTAENSRIAPKMG